MTGVRPETARGLQAVNGINALEDGEESRDILRSPRVDDIQVECTNRSAVQNGRKPPDYHEFNPAFAQSAQGSQKITGRHSIHGLRGLHLHGAERLAGARPGKETASTGSA